MCKSLRNEGKIITSISGSRRSASVLHRSLQIEAGDPSHLKVVVDLEAASALSMKVVVVLALDHAPDFGGPQLLVGQVLGTYVSLNSPHHVQFM